jgi:hypothetical protein
VAKQLAITSISDVLQKPINMYNPYSAALSWEDRWSAERAQTEEDLLPRIHSFEKDYRSLRSCFDTLLSEQDVRETSADGTSSNESKGINTSAARCLEPIGEKIHELSQLVERYLSQESLSWDENEDLGTACKMSQLASDIEDRIAAAEAWNMERLTALSPSSFHVSLSNGMCNSIPLTLNPT